MSAAASEPASQAAITATPPTRGMRWTFRRGDLSDLANPDDAAAMRRTARVLGCEEAELRAAAKTSTAEPGARNVALQVWNGKAEPESVREPLSPGLIVPKLSMARRVSWSDPALLACVALQLEPGSPASQREAGESLCSSSGADAAWVRSGTAWLLFAAEDDVPAHHKAAASAFAIDRFDASPRVISAEIRTDFSPPGPADLWAGHTPLAAAAWRATSPSAERIEADDHRVSDLLERLGLHTGAERFAHDLCPINPSHLSGRDPVVVLDRGVWCHSCDGRTGDGWRTWSELLVESRESGLRLAHPWVDAARSWVHWEHARRVLPALSVSARAAEWAYAGLLRATHGLMRKEDPASFEELATSVFNPGLLWVRGDSGRWLHAQHLGPIDLRDAELATMPWVRGRRELVALARSTQPLAGYTPIRPCSAILNPDSVPPGTVARRPDRDSASPPSALDPAIEPLPYSEALAVLHTDYPGIDDVYLQLLLCSMACSEAGGQPVILVAHGPSGAGKTQTINLAASIAGARVCDVTDAFGGEEEAWRRRVGDALVGGQRPLVVNDVHRSRGLHQRLKLIIGLEDPLTYRPLYSPATAARLVSPFVLTCVTYPTAMGAVEFARRVRVYRLAVSVDWSERIHPTAWRDTPTDDEVLAGTPPATWLRIRAAEGLLAEALRLARANRFRWFSCTQALGAALGEEANPEQAALDAALLHRLFDHVCGREGVRVPSSSARWPGDRGWVDLGSPAALRILDELMPDLGEQKDTRHLLTQTLMEIDWTKTLQSSVPVRFLGNTRHQTWVGRFEGVGMRGQVPINEEIA